MNSRNKKELLNMLSAVTVIVLVYGLFNLAGITCPIKYITGISCLGCGMTRAWISVLHLDLKGAFYYHPGFLLPLAALVLFIIKSQGDKNIKFYKFYKISMFTIIMLFVIIYVVRIVWTEGDIVVFQPENNILSRFMRNYIH